MTQKPGAAPDCCLVALDEAEAGGDLADAIFFFLHRSRLIFGTVLHGFGPYCGLGQEDRSRLIISGLTLPASHVLVHYWRAKAISSI